MNISQAFSLVKQAASAWIDDYAPSMGAALAYYTLFSIAPLLLIVIAVAGVVFGAEAARGQIVGQLGGLLGEQGAQAVQGLLASASKPAQGIVATITGVVLLLVGATSVFSELQSALDRIWRAPARQASSGLWDLLRSRLLSFGMILGIGFLLLVSLVVGAMLAALGKWWGPMFGGWTVLASAFNLVLGFGLVTAMFAMIYKLMPRVKIEWHDVWIGALVTAALFTVGKYLIGLYIGKSGVASTFGAAGSMVVLLLWVYYSAQIFLMGAEFTWVYAHTFGSLKSTPAAAATASTPIPAATPDIPAPAVPTRNGSGRYSGVGDENPAPSWRTLGLGLVAGGVVGWATRKGLQLARARGRPTTRRLMTAPIRNRLRAFAR